MTLSPSDWTDRALSGETVWNIGQLCPSTVRALDRLARQGRLVKGKALWAGLRLKTVWARPDVAERMA